MDGIEDLINKCTIWKLLGGVSAMSGLVCFGLSFTYKISFGKLGICGLLVYLLISSIMLCLICFVKKIRVPQRFQAVVATLLLVVICLISVELDKLVPRKSDVLSIISYGLFAILSLCASRKSELGFETGFFTFFVSLFLEQIYKTNLKLFPIAVIFCLVILVLRHRSQSGNPNGDEESQDSSLSFTSSQETGFFTFFLSLFSEQLFRINWNLLPIALGFSFPAIRHRHRSQSGSPNGDRPPEVVPFINETPEVVPFINETAPATDHNHEDLDLERQDPPRVGQDLLESLSSESYEAAPRHTSNNGGVLGVSEESRLAVVGDHQQNNDQEETPSSFPARQDSPGMGEVSGQSLFSTDNQQNNQEESSQATHHSPRIVQVSDESILEDWVNQNQEEEDPWSLPPESWEQEQVSSGNNQNGWMHSSAEAGLLSAEPSGLRRRRTWITTEIQNIPSRVGATLGSWRWQVVPAFFFFKKINSQ